MCLCALRPLACDTLNARRRALCRAVATLRGARPPAKMGSWGAARTRLQEASGRCRTVQVTRRCDVALWRGTLAWHFGVVQ